MAFTTPTLNELVRVAENGMANAFGGESSVLRKSVTKVLARVFAGVAFLLVLMLQKMWKNSFVTTCDVEALKSFGSDFDVPNKPESYAVGKVIVKSSSTSSVISQGTVFQTSDGTEYETVAETALSGGENGTEVGVISVESGEGSNIDAGAALTFRDGTPEGVDDSVVVAGSGIVGGKKIEVNVGVNTEYWGETIEEYRQRILDYRRNQSIGGNDGDYKSWAERFQGVSRCIVEPNHPSAGAVTCVLVNYGECDAVEVDGSVVDEVRGYIESRRFVTANVNVKSCIRKAVDFEIGIKPNNSERQEIVRKSLKNALKNYKPGDTIDNESLTAELISCCDVEKIAVSKIGGGVSVVLDKVNSEIPVIGSIVWKEY